jgi:hypothetical protein
MTVHGKITTRVAHWWGICARLRKSAEIDQHLAGLDVEAGITVDCDSPR